MAERIDQSRWDTCPEQESAWPVCPIAVIQADIYPIPKRDFDRKES